MQAGRVFYGLAVILLLLAISLRARADDRRTARLDYDRALAATACPSEVELRAAVAGRLGYDPFIAGSRRVVHARITRERERLQAFVSVDEPDGSRRERGPISSAAMDCHELGEALSLALSIAVDPLALVRGPEHVETSAPAVVPAPVVEPRREPAPAVADEVSRRPETRRLEWRAYGGGAMGVGWTPAPSPSIVAGAGLAWSKRYAIFAEGRHDLGGSAAGPDGSSIHATVTSVSIAPCLELLPFAVCALGTVGSLAGEGRGVDRPTSQRSMLAAAGLRGTFEQHIVGPLAARFTLDAEWVLAPVRQRILDAQVWESPVIVASAGAALAVHFP
jgi:hypothetical protein